MSDLTGATPITVAADETFAVVPTWVILSSISDRAVRLYAVLRRYADRDGACWPSRSRLAGDMRCSVDSIDRALAELVGICALTITHRRDASGAPTSSLYTVRSTPVYRPVDNSGGSRTGAARGSRTAAAGVAAPVRHELEPLNQKTPPPPLRGGACAVHGDNPVPNRRCCGTTARQLAQSIKASRPDWCGACDRDTRLVEVGARVSRCADCHPLAIGASS